MTEPTETTVPTSVATTGCAAGELPETFEAQQILCAIDQFLEYGESTCVDHKEIEEPGHRGYYSGQGWAARCLRYHREQMERMKTALERIERWFGEFPETGKFWDDDPERPMTYGACYGSNGERDFMRQVARKALGSD